MINNKSTFNTKSNSNSSDLVLDNSESSVISIKLSIQDFTNPNIILGRSSRSLVILLIHKNIHYALKIVKKKLVSKLMEPFILNEKKIFQQIFFKHPNILDLLGFYEDKENFYFFFPRLAGPAFGLSLFQFILFLNKKRNVIPLNIIREWAWEILNVLSFIHSKGIIHLDIKPENFLISNKIKNSAELIESEPYYHKIEFIEDKACEWNDYIDYDKIINDSEEMDCRKEFENENFQKAFKASQLGLYLTDFQFAHQINSDNNSLHYGGTVHYMSPERLKRNKYSFEADYWSFGILLYHMAFGRAPFYSDSRELLIKSILNSDQIDFPDGGQFAQNNDPHLISLIRKLLTQDLNHRLIDLKEIFQSRFFDNQRTSKENAHKKI